MNAYAWTSWAVAGEVAVVLAASLGTARALDRLPPRAAVPGAVAMLPILLLVLVWLASAEPTGTRMLVFTAGTLVAMKAIVLQVHRAGGGRPLSFGPWLLFTLSWFGMNPRTLAIRRRGPGASARAVALLRRGLLNLIAGLLLVTVACWIGSPWMTPLLMVGISLAMHFGLFTLTAALLAALGFPARVLFDAPLRARSLQEFWAQRWNRGFAEMTALCVQRPLAPRIGRRRALFVSFLSSGLLHELAISLPVGAGYGLPTCYFALQGFMAMHERAQPGRLATLLRVVLPVPLVFHPWFVHGTMLPLLG